MRNRSTRALSKLTFGPGHFRVLLAILVVFSHMSSVEIGRPAVFVFFMLSGYWVLRMYEQKYHPSTSVWVFYLSRFMRVWLAFATAFLVVFLFYVVFSDPKSLETLGGLSLLGVASTKNDVLGTSWSLDIELQFYLLVPLLSLALANVQKNWKQVAFALMIGMILTAFGWYLQTDKGLWTVLSYMPSFMIGVLIWHTQARSSGKTATLSVFFFVMVGMVVWLSPVLRPLLLSNVDGPFNEDWFGMAWVTLLVPFVVWNVQQKSNSFDVHVGNYSYALYITHWPVIAFLGPAMQPASVLEKALILSAILVVSLVFYVSVDRGWESVRRRTIRSLTKFQPH